MGTNYYVQQKPPCECCKRGYEDLHIGKSSSGWKFGFRAYREDSQEVQDGAIPFSITDFDAWKKYLAGKKIFDEYARKIELDDLLELIELKQDGLSQCEESRLHGYDGDYIDKDGYEFSYREFS